MMEVLSLPPLATVQDLGRPGFWAQGLGTAGAMDPLAHRLANLLLGNLESDATLEIPLTPARFRFTQDTGFAIAGAICDAALDGVPLPRNWAGRAQTGQVLDFGGMRDGARMYLALPGGIDVAPVLGSRSTQLREGFGGYDGRVLVAGDTLVACDPQRITHSGLSYALPGLRPAGQPDINLRVLRSAETAEFTADSLACFFGQAFKVTPASNRQGYRLAGPTLERAASGELRSHGIAPGIVQVPGGGQVIIQLADAATMGGYPKIACVIATDLWRLGQARPGDRLRFTQVDLATAHEIEHAAVADLSIMRDALGHVAAGQN